MGLKFTTSGRGELAVGHIGGCTAARLFSCKLRNHCEKARN
jgi:hypothetical protein